MQALVFRGAHALAVEEVPEPAPAVAGEVLLEVNACGICGSDLHGYLGHSPRRNAHVPLVMGHELTGRIAAFGPGVEVVPGLDLELGDRVVVNPLIACRRCPACRAGRENICPNMSLVGVERPGGFAPRVWVPLDRLVKLPPHVDDRAGAMVETLAVEVHLFREMAPPLPRTTVVLGAGAQGLLAVQLARLAGASQVIVSDLVPQRLALAERMGASTVVAAGEEDAVERVLTLTSGWGAELVIDAVGAPAIRQQGVKMLAPGGTLALVGLGKGETTLDFIPVVGKELMIRGSYGYSDDDFLRALELIATGQIRVADMVATAPLSEGVDLFGRLLQEPGALTKVVLLPA